ncbi:cryptochrome/photolyase family protein [Methylomonas sp. MED-D]|uniref:cryptochrome/photolyase family protein n=1 Tax=unclassified Methylomonas TaxID=2608980 RepID=UPI0028A34BC4|nr:deoxyribodipyrimidine photo-lyase [Methylomonas sp. MV1]MDT4329024.1 deoxyribodipyrimidine photo-lyase [Methylomonas sp. MV1]
MSDKPYRVALFLFRRDLRVDDNTALNAARRGADRVITAFAFDPRQIEAHTYQSQPGLQYMLEAVAGLQRDLVNHGGKLYCFATLPHDLIARLRETLGLDAVYINRDYTPFSLRRDAEIRECCNALGVALHITNDLLLTEPEQIASAKGNPIQVFTPFYRRARQIPVAAPAALADGGWYTDTLAGDDADLPERYRRPHRNPIAGGRASALQSLQAVSSCRDYAQNRDFPALAQTSRLSVHLKFGTCSVREAYAAIQHQLGPEHPLLRQLYWRDFFSHIAYRFPHVFGQAFDRRYDAVPWRNNLDDFTAWTKGLTGFPIVDAAMRELKQTGWMHNRLRMVVSSFLVKDLHISWRWGERYFAQHLLDYDPCVNNGNWQWAASTGCDAQPYFRIFNPWLQQQKFDPQCDYIKTWLPELRAYSAKVIHQWASQPLAGAYPPPIVEHGTQSRLIKAQFKALTTLPIQENSDA